MKKNLEEFFKKKNFFMFTPRLYSFGGSFESLSESLKISTFKNKKIILCIPFFNLHKKHKKKKIFCLSIVTKIFFKISIIEKLLSLVFTIYLNFSLILKFMKIRGLISIIIGKNQTDLFLPLYFGYNGLDNNNYFKCDSFLWRDILSKKVNYLKKSFNDSKVNKKKVAALYVKDSNYSKISEISSSAVSNIENYRKSIEYIISKNFDVYRLGDSLSNNFIFENDSFFDYTKSKKNILKIQYDTYPKADFFFGSNTPGINIATFFDKKRLIVNTPVEYSSNTQSFSKENFSIFKKAFSLKKKKILSLEEILSDQNLFIDEISDLNSSKDYILIENSPEEILDACKAFINFNFYNIKEDENLLNQYLEIRSKNIKKLFRSSSELMNIPSINKYEYGEVNIPFSFLQKYLFNSKELDEESKKFSKFSKI